MPLTWAVFLGVMTLLAFALIAALTSVADSGLIIGLLIAAPTVAIVALGLQRLKDAQESPSRQSPLHKQERRQEVVGPIASIRILAIVAFVCPLLASCIVALVAGSFWLIGIGMVLGGSAVIILLATWRLFGHGMADRGMRW